MAATASRRWGYLAVFLLMAGLLWQLSGDLLTTYDQQVMRPNLRYRQQGMVKIVGKRAESPYRYRLLYPALTQALLPLVTPAAPEPELRSYHRADLWLSAASFFLLLATTLWLVARQVSPWAGVLALILTAWACRTTLCDHGYQPWSYLEPVFLNLSLIAIFAQRARTAALIFFIAVVNRETAIFLPLLLIPELRGPQRRRWIAAPLAALCAFGLVRLWQGAAHHPTGPAWVWAQNMADWAMVKESWRDLFGPLWGVALVALVYLARQGWRYAPYLCATMASIAVFGLWRETRLLTSVLPIWILGVCATVDPIMSRAAGAGRAAPDAPAAGR